MSRTQADPHQITTISSALADAQPRLAGGTDTPDLDARVLLAHIIQKEQSFLFAHPESPLSSAQIQSYEESLMKIVSGIPLPYVLGSWEFFGLTFKVSPEVLIPRPETELLVETALDWLKKHPEKTRVAEAGTGSGCISISLAVHHPKLDIAATDISPAALNIAVENAVTHQVASRINFQEDDLFTNLKGKFDLICANLPYIPTANLKNLDVAQREPTLALDGGADGLDMVRRLLDQSVILLAEGGLILLEIEDQQGGRASKISKEKFPEAAISVRLDLAGIPRLLVIGS